MLPLTARSPLSIGVLVGWALRAEGAVELPPGEYRIEAISDAIRVWVDGWVELSVDIQPVRRP